MKPLRVLALLCLAVNLSAQAIAHDSEVANVTVASGGVAKDPRAVSLLAQMLAATGWTKQAAPGDAVLSGSVTRYFGDKSQSTSFTIQLGKRDQYRYEEEGSSFITNGHAGAFRNASGKVTRIPPHAILESRRLVLPMLSIISDWNSPDVEVTYVGPSSVEGEAVIGIQLNRQDPDNDPLAKAKRLTSPIVAWISTARWAPVRVDYQIPALDSSRITTHETVLFFDYRTVDGMAMPFRQDVFFGDQRIKTMQLTGVRFNTGLTDADFKVSAMVAGGAR
jgi:hypothetical protein